MFGEPSAFTPRSGKRRIRLARQYAGTQTRQRIRSPWTQVHHLCCGGYSCFQLHSRISIIASLQTIRFFQRRSSQSQRRRRQRKCRVLFLRCCRRAVVPGLSDRDGSGCGSWRRHDHWSVDADRAGHHRQGLGSLSSVEIPRCVG